MPTTAGIDLKLERVRASVTVTALALEMGRSRQMVHGWERAGRVPPDRAEEYRAALGRLRDATEAPPTGTAA